MSESDVEELGAAQLTGFQRDLLAVLSHHDNLHGLGIKELIQARYGKEIHHGRLYPNLDTLVDKGLVRKSQRDRRTNEYATTRIGEQTISQYTEWLAGDADE